MFKCIDCGRTFRTPDTRYERHGFTEPPYEEWDCCPYCGGDVEIFTPTKVVLFNETVKDGRYMFIAGVPYTITFENEDVYYLGKQNGHVVGVERKLEGSLFEIDEVDFDEPQ